MNSAQTVLAAAVFFAVLLCAAGCGGASSDPPSDGVVATLDGQPKQPPTHLEVRAVRRAEPCRRRRHAEAWHARRHLATAVHGLLWHDGTDAARHRSMQRWSMSLKEGDGDGYK